MQDDILKGQFFTDVSHLYPRSATGSLDAVINVSVDLIPFSFCESKKEDN